MSDFKQWRRAKVATPDGETKVRFDATSSNTLSMVKLESSAIIDELKLAEDSARIYIDEHGDVLARDKQPIQKLTLFLRDKHPALDGRQGKYILSDKGFEELINGVWFQSHRGAAETIYDAENERAAKRDHHKLTAQTSKTYRKQSKPNTRQKNQAKPGRPRKNLS